MYLLVLYFVKVKNSERNGKVLGGLVDFKLLWPKASIHGIALGNSTPEEYNEMGCAIVAGIEAGWVNPVINREYAMEEVCVK